MDLTCLVPHPNSPCFRSVLLVYLLSLVLLFLLAVYYKAKRDFFRPTTDLQQEIDFQTLDDWDDDDGPTSNDKKEDAGGSVQTDGTCCDRGESDEPGSDRCGEADVRGNHRSTSGHGGKAYFTRLQKRITKGVPS